MFCRGDQYLYDPFNEDARKAVFKAFMQGYGKYGIKTIWIDAAEPERMDAANVGNWKFKLGTDAEVGEAWVQQHTRMIADGMASVGIQPDEYVACRRFSYQDRHMFFLIELRQALILYQDYHMLSLTFAGEHGFAHLDKCAVRSSV